MFVFLSLPVLLIAVVSGRALVRERRAGAAAGWYAVAFGLSVALVLLAWLAIVLEVVMQVSVW